MSEPAPEPEAEKDHADVRVPPPLIYIGMLALALGLDLAVDGPRLTATVGLPESSRYIAGFALFVIGLALPISAVTLFRSAGTEVRPWKPSTALVTTGIYRFTRNPMYLGMAFVYAGLSVLADSAIALIALAPLLVIVTYAVIKREEHYLEVTFGEPYRVYKRKVRRWI
jgi:protein-S-isoprenylcysteine O-methyltransferase Ste14